MLYQTSAVSIPLFTLANTGYMLCRQILIQLGLKESQQNDSSGGV